MRRHKSIPQQSVPAAAQDLEPIDDSFEQADPVWMLDFACCCPSYPAVRVVMPVTPERPRTSELLLCGHHYRSSREALFAAGASVYDRGGALISSGAPLD